MTSMKTALKPLTGIINHMKNDSLVIKNYPVPKQTHYQKLRACLKANYYSVTFFYIVLNNIFNFTSKSPSSLNDVGYLVTEKLLLEIQKYCSQKNIEFVIASVPLETNNRQRMKKFTSVNNIKYLDLHSVFQSASDFTIPNDGHWNAKGHSIAAEAIFQYLKNNQIFANN